MSGLRHVGEGAPLRDIEVAALGTAGPWPDDWHVTGSGDSSGGAVDDGGRGHEAEQHTGEPSTPSGDRGKPQQGRSRCEHDGREEGEVAKPS